MQFSMEPNVGSIGLVHVTGSLGKLIGFLEYNYSGSTQALHSFIVLDNNMVLESNYKTGSRIVPLDKYLGRAVYLNYNLTHEQRYKLNELANNYVGIKYSYLEYLLMAMAKFRREAKWLSNKIINSNKTICSSLVAIMYMDIGITIAANPYLLSPGMLAQLYLQHDGII